MPVEARKYPELELQTVVNSDGVWENEPSSSGGKANTLNCWHIFPARTAQNTSRGMS